MTTQPPRVRFIALVGALPRERQMTQTAAFPMDVSKMLPEADVVLLVADADPGAMLFRYTAHGEAAGDTWHPSPDDAREQAAEEYGDALGEWEPVPAEVADAHRFAIGVALERLDERR